MFTLAVPQTDKALVYIAERDCRHCGVQISPKEETSMYSSGYWIISEHPVKVCARVDLQLALTDAGKYPVPGITEIAVVGDSNKRRVNMIMAPRRVAACTIYYEKDFCWVEDTGRGCTP